ncbi:MULTISPECIES: GNAT family N-acetyltransferase [Thermococcus]|uniref:N-acetyltransferase n=1 Tax=Thermococcus sibiricus (strain DSM 12597 / MM 739) TaxID=604354 RepID=C6A2P6_THESM|nr:MULTISPECIES: GNAT family N-acetyltransferase [Thermococcus]ACS89891.1 N-acetyltransferase [Thermococcus sibiricus MM 739]KUK28157.1 MAG: N-acetyltransferase [Thermococcus sp. 40_45]
MVAVRIATLEDTEEIVDVHCSGIERWFRKSENRETSYKELSIRERYLHGGPWMSIETCAIHLNYLLLEGQIPLVAEVDGKIIGNAEVLISEEPIKGEIMKIAHIDVLEVHKNFRGEGVGREIIKFVEELAKENGCELVTVTPEKSAVGFYKKVGIEEIIHKASFVEFDLEQFSEEIEPELFKFSWNEIEGLEMVAGKFQTSYHHWFTAFKDRIAGIDDKNYLESGRIRGSYYVLEESFFDRSLVTAYLWGKKEDLILLLSRAGSLGFRKLRTIIEKDLVEKFEPKTLDSVVILAKRL